MSPMISMTSMTISESRIDTQLLAASSFTACPAGIPGMLPAPASSRLLSGSAPFVSRLTPSAANSTRPTSSAHTMEWPVISIRIILAMKMINAITRLITGFSLYVLPGICK